MGKPLGGYPDGDMAELTPFFDTDGKLLVMEADYHPDLYHNARFFAGACIGIAIFILIVNLLIALGMTLDAFDKSMIYASAWVLLLGLLVYFGSNYIIKTGYIVFDRDHGTVMLPVKHNGRRWVLPFKDIQCYGFTMFMKGGFIRYEVYLYGMSKPRGTKDFKQKVLIGYYTVREEAEKYWRIVENFMDTTRPIPDVIPFPQRIRWFKARNTSIAEYYKHPRPYDYPLETIDASAQMLSDEELSKLES
jgi:hypothetical protein